MPPSAPNPSLKGQKALVTGASSGIGKAIALAMAAAGADVVLNYFGNDEQAQRALAEANELGKPHGSRGMLFKGDVSKEDHVHAMFELTLREFGTIDILINNAGLQQDAPVDQMSLAQWQRVIDVNLTGQFLCTRAAIREFKRRGIREGVSRAAGKIVHISSVHDVIPWAGHVNYAASKGGVMLLMKSVAQEVAALRIRVNSICPGAIRTPINRAAWETPQAYNDLMRLVPYKRIGEPEDIAKAAVWLASDESDYITGANLYVDGGMTLYPGFESGG